jgi:hypothetical protein
MTFYWKFVDTLAYNVATIAAIVVGVVQFFIRAFNENNGAEKVRNFALQSLKFIDNLIELGQSKLEVQEVAQPTKVVRNRKRKVA